jgi:hypothetical protein
MEHQWTRRTRRSEPGATPAAPQPDGLPQAMAFVQHAAGNRAMAQLLRKTKTKAPEVSDKAARRDYENAKDYVIDFYDGVRDALNLKNEVVALGIKGYDDFSELKDPPDLTQAIVSAVVSGVADLIPGGAAIKKGLSIGIFAYDTAKLSEHEVYPGVEADKGEASKKAGEIYEKGKSVREKVNVGVEAGKKIQEAAAKRKEASEAEERAKERSEREVKRVADWASHVSQSRAEEKEFKDWLKWADDTGRYRGNLVAEVKKSLGEIPVIPEGGREEVIRKLAARYELALYRAKFANLMLVRSVSGWEDYEVVETRFIHSDDDPSDLMKQADDITGAVKRRVAYLVGDPRAATDDERLARHLSITVYQRAPHKIRGKRPDYEHMRPGRGRMSI